MIIRVGKRLDKTFRLIYGITTINSDKIFQEHVWNMYPDSLTLNKENIDDTRAHVLDLEINMYLNVECILYINVVCI